MSPKHVAIIMDGNRRWAEERGLPIAFGYQQGVTVLRQTLLAARTAGVSVVTAYAFSEENWNRPTAEVDILMNLCGTAARGELRALADEDVRVRLCGRNDRLPASTCAALDDLVELTAGNTGITLNLAIDYGGRREISDAVRALVGEVSAGLRDAATIDERAIQSRLYTAGLTRSRPRHPHRRRTSDLELSLIPSRVRRVLGNRNVLARFRRSPSAVGTRRLRAAPTALRNLAYDVRSNVAIQFGSHVLPPSAENDCSNRNAFAVISENTKRTKMARPPNVSWS